MKKVNRRNETNDGFNTKNTVKLLWIPGIWAKNTKKQNKIGCKVEFTPAANRKNILCINKSKFLPSSYTGVYQLGCK